LNDLNLDSRLIITKSNELEPIYNDPYLEVYSKLIEFSRRQNITDQTTLIGLAHMVYGWMPTIITFDTNIKIDNHIFDKISLGNLDIDFLTELIRVVNNSIVGVSKLLHFLNNNDYAIWDSRVYYSITGNKPHAYRVNLVHTYIDYMNKINKVLEDLDLELIKQKLMDNGYCTSNVSNTRMIELILFYTGKQKE